MTAFQPAPPVDGLYYPSATTPLGGGFYDVADLVETPTGSNLYAFQVGDYAYPSLVPIPHIELTIFTLDDATVTITVYRTANGRTVPVRGQVNVYAVGGRSTVDWEAPFGVPLTYQAEQFDGDGNSLGYTAPFTTRLDVTDTWVHNPFDPAGGVAVTMTNNAAVKLTSPSPTDYYYAAGSGLAVQIGRQRHGLDGVPVPFLTRTETETDKVRAMFGDPYTSPSLPSVLVIRTGAGKNMRLPQPFYASIPDSAETPLDTQTGGSLTLWDCVATEIAPPAPGLVAAVLTLADIDATYATLADIDAAYGTLFDIDRDYSIAGTAGDQ